MIMRNYLDDLIRLPRDTPVFSGFKELLKLGAVVAVKALSEGSQPIVLLMSNQIC